MTQTADEQDTPGRCPNSRCHKPAHPDHPNGHVITGSTWPDAKDRAESLR